MKTITQKLWMVVAALCMSISASAYDFEVDGIAYTITSFSDLTVRVDQLVNTDVTELAIPKSVDYKNKTLIVTSIKDSAFEDNVKLTEVSLPNTINSIGNKAFMNNLSLIGINSPISLSYLGSEAFAGCSSLKTFYIPEGVKKIRDRTFYGCNALKSIELHTSINSIGEAAFCNSGLQSITIPSSVVSIGDGAFARTHLLEINLHEGIEIIPSECFKGCSELQKITFSSNVISSSAFENCIALQEIILPEGLTTIGERAFAGCDSLKEFAIPSSVTEIHPSILWDCQNIETLKIGIGLKGLPFYVDYADNVTQISTLGSYRRYDKSYPKFNIDELYLRGVKKFIIEDSNETFSLKGFYLHGVSRPPFIDTDLDYYYVGRPLVNITGWSSASTSFYVEIKQGTGRINKLEIGGKCTSVPFFYQKIDTLKLGANIKEFDLPNIYKEDLVKIECLSVTPPTCKNVAYTFPTKVYTDAILCVPFGCKEAYAKAEVWKNFWNISEIDSTSGITELLNDKDDVLYNVYNIVGLQVGESYSLKEIRQLPKGIYILVNKSHKYKLKI